MPFRLKTVRAKLTMLVGLSIAVMLATLPVLSWLLHKQLLDEVDDRVVEAEKSFDAELTDDLSDLTLASRVIAADADTIRALKEGDAKGARALADIFLRVYPDIDIVFADINGKVLAQVGCTTPPDALTGYPEFANVLKGQEFRGIVAHGCERADSDKPPAAVIATPVKDAGTLVVCLPLDKDFLLNASVKLGLELAFVKETEQLSYARTSAFPVGSARAAHERASSLFEGDGGTWAVARFSPSALKAAGGRIDVVTALDVADIQTIVRRNLFFAFAVLIFAAIVSVIAGTRIARIMSNALGRVSTALKKVQVNEYEHVDGVKTGDEIEALASGFNTMVDGLKERDKYRNMLGKYMTESVLEYLKKGNLELGGRTIQVTILFTDIRSFTSISENMDAQALVAFLNEYFTEMVGIVMEEGGVVDKYIGDAIMAVFGAPVPRPDDAIRAVRAAVRMRQALAVLNVRLAARGIAELKTGIGIHSGNVVSGHIGSERRMEYTVIGDAVNLASRLESNTKDLGVNILISEDTYQLTKSDIDSRQIREITVKGRAQAVMTYEVLGIKGETPLVRAESAKPDLTKAAIS